MSMPLEMNNTSASTMQNLKISFDQPQNLVSQFTMQQQQQPQQEQELKQALEQELQNEQATMSYGDSKSMSGMMMKLMNNNPGDLPSGMLDSLVSWMQSAPSWLASSIRPGCVEMRVHAALASPASRSAESLVRFLLEEQGDVGEFFRQNAAWRASTNGGVCDVRAGKVVQVIATESMVVTSRVGAALHVEAGGHVTLAGQFPASATVICLLDGKLVACEVQHQGADRIVVHVPGQSDVQSLRVMVVEVEAAGHLVGVPVLLSPCATLVAEVQGLAAAGMPLEELTSLLVGD